MMFRYFSLALSLVLSAAVVDAADKEQGRLENCGTVMEEIVDLPDGIPQELLEKAECVVVIRP
jgi:SH3 domain-containing YSC84-like protein 1